MNRLNARNRLLLALAVILIIAFLGGSYLNYKMTRASVHAEIIKNDLPLTMDNIYSELIGELTRPLLVSSSMASDTFLIDWVENGEKDEGKIIRYLGGVKEKYGFFTTFFVSAQTLKYYRYSGLHKTISKADSHDVWFYSFLESDSEYDFDVDTDEAASNVLTIFINYRVVSESGKLLGVTGVGLKVARVAETVAEYEKKYSRTVYLSDTSGIIQVHPNTQIIEKKSISQFDGMQGMDKAILKKQNDHANYEYERDGNTILLTVRYIEPLDWFLFVEQNETQSLATARTNFKRTAVIGFVASAVIIVLTLITINRYQRTIELLAISDELTGAANRRALEIEFKKVAYENSRSGRNFALLLLDLDGFKKVNDLLGHNVGDSFLVDIVSTITEIVRPTDMFARWGGDEFVILTNSDEPGAMMIANRVRQIVFEKDFLKDINSQNDPRDQVTLSCGVTMYKKGDDLDSMLLRADSAMYQCKSRGGNCVELGTV